MPIPKDSRNIDSTNKEIKQLRKQKYDLREEDVEYDDFEVQLLLANRTYGDRIDSLIDLLGEVCATPKWHDNELRRHFRVGGEVVGLQTTQLLFNLKTKGEAKYNQKYSIAIGDKPTREDEEGIEEVDYVDKLSKKIDYEYDNIGALIELQDLTRRPPRLMSYLEGCFVDGTVVGLTVGKKIADSLLKNPQMGELYV